MKKKFDYVLFFALVGLALFSSFSLLGIDKKLFITQLIYFVVGFLFLFIFFKIGSNFFRLNCRFFYLTAVILILITFFFGETIRGSKRWLNFYFLNFQASEFLKMFFIIYLADYFKRQSSSLISFKKVFFSLIIFLPPVFLILKQPDLGSVLVYLLIYLSILFFSGLPVKYFIYLLLFFILIAPLSWSLLADYQKNRVLSFINPEFDPAGISYNLIQSVITVGAGRFLGHGLGRGTQSRFLFLPENTTDFAYASLVEQFGFIGGIVVIGLYIFIFYRLFKKTFNQPYYDYHFLFLVGVTIFLATQVFINIGMNLGIVPVAGIPLPLISYGGSSVVSTLMLFGLAMSI